MQCLCPNLGGFTQVYLDLCLPTTEAFCVGWYHQRTTSLWFLLALRISQVIVRMGGQLQKKVLWRSAQRFRSLFWGCGLRIDLLPWTFWIPWTPFVGVGTWGCKSHRHQKSPGQTKAPLLQGWQTHLLSVAAHSVIALCSNTAAAQVKLGGGLAVNLAFGLLFRDKLAWISWEGGSHFLCSPSVCLLSVSPE